MTRITETEARRLLRGLLRADAAPRVSQRPAAPRPSERQGSALETMFAAALELHAPDLAAGAVREFVFAPPRRFRFDFCWPARLVAAECDGGQWAAGGGRHNTDGDRAKLNLAASRGWRVLRFSGAMLRADPAGCVALVRAALEVRP